MAKSSANKELAIRRAHQIQEIDAAILHLSAQQDIFKNKIAQHSLLTSVVDGLYEELDKLTKKAPADKITCLALTQVNDVIRDTKELCEGDTYVQRQVEFVAAGDNPEHRDALVVLTQIRQGLHRFGTKAQPELERIIDLLSDAKGVKIALNLFCQGGTTVSRDSIKHNGENVSDRWTSYNSLEHEQCFAFHVIDRTDIPSYFR